MPVISINIAWRKVTMVGNFDIIMRTADIMRTVDIKENRTDMGMELK